MSADERLAEIPCFLQAPNSSSSLYIIYFGQRFSLDWVGEIFFNLVYKGDKCFFFFFNNM
jgi:hypothetical protein